MNSRASLPSADELFGGGRSNAPSPESPIAHRDIVDPRIFLEVRRLTAPESTAQVETRDRASGTHQVPNPEIGALLRWAVAACGGRAVVEIGAAGGVTGLWMLPGLPDRGVLTSIDPDPHSHELSTAAFRNVGAGQRVRSILGEPDTVLPRLSDGGYDLVLLQTEASTYPEALIHVRRLLRPGGTLIARQVLRNGEHGESLARFVQALTDDPAFTTAILPIDHGLALATRNGAAD